MFNGIRATGIFAALLLAGCTADTSTSALQVDPEVAELANAKRVVLDDAEADSLGAKDIINRSKTHVRRTGEIYLMRGLANVFSRGIDEMARTLRQNGYDAANFSYTEWKTIADDIIIRDRSGSVSKPVIIVGHSLGGNESSKFANYLSQNTIEVALLVAFDPVETGQVGPGIAKVVNYYLPKSADNRILPAEGFTGILNNIDVTVDPEITHVNVDKNAVFQAETFKEIAALTSERKRQTRSVGRRPITER
ncbi:MAG: hypothetical protein AAF217_11490 [Pseudomonadota bacterium]